MQRRLRTIIEGGPPECILLRLNDMFQEKEEATHIRAAEVMRELGWDAADQSENATEDFILQPKHKTTMHC